MIRVGFHSNDPARQTSVVGSRVRDARRRRSSPLPPAAPVPRASSRAMPRVDPSVVRRRVLDRLRESDVEVDESDLPDVRPPSRASHRAIGSRLSRASSSSDGRPPWCRGAPGASAPQRASSTARGASLSLLKREAAARGPARAASRTFATPTVARAWVLRRRALRRRRPLALARRRARRGGAVHRPARRPPRRAKRQRVQPPPPRVAKARARTPGGPSSRRPLDDDRPRPRRRPRPRPLLRGERTPEPAPQGGAHDDGGRGRGVLGDDGARRRRHDGRRRGAARSLERGGLRRGRGRDPPRVARGSAGSSTATAREPRRDPCPGPGRGGFFWDPRGDERGGLLTPAPPRRRRRVGILRRGVHVAERRRRPLRRKRGVGHVLPGVPPRGRGSLAFARARAGGGRRRRRRCPGRGGILGGRVGRVRLSRRARGGARARRRPARFRRRVRVPVGRGRGRARGRHGRGRGRRRAFARGFRRVATARGGFGRGLGFGRGSARRRVGASRG